MNNLHELLKIHKETVLITGNGFAVDCILQPPSSNDGFELKGLTSFIGLTFEDNHNGFFGDSFELTIDYNALKEKTDLIPVRGWGIVVKFPQLNNEPVPFKIENVAFDRTLGMYLIKCSASTMTGNPKSVQRQSSGGM